MKEKISVILINYNTAKDTLECVKSIELSEKCNINIIIVDNNSSDKDYGILKNGINDNNFNVKLIRNDKNVGFAGGNNIGIKYALYYLKSDYILLLNNDTLIEHNTIYQLLRTMKSHEKCGIVGGKIYYYPQKDILWYAGGTINWSKFTTKNYGIRLKDRGQYDEEKEVDFITGCTMLIKKEIFDKVGLLNERYFMYYEDTDFCVKCLEAGYSLYYTPKAKIYHKVSLSSGGEESLFGIEYKTRNRKYFMNKFRYKVGRLNYIYSVTFFYITRYIKVIGYIIKKQNSKGQAILKGLCKDI